MDFKQFYKSVESHDSLEGVGVTDSSVIVNNIQQKTTYNIPFLSIEAHTWDDLCSVLGGHRDPSVLQHMTRIVGYFSRVSNWNTSKVAELADRHEGEYSITR